MFRNKSGFTMAELLVAMTVIALLTVIVMPAIYDQLSEKSWNLHKKALYSRMAQAISMMPRIAGYGEYFVTDNGDGTSTVTDTTAISFVTEGLGKVLSFNNICGNTADDFKKCGLPDRVITQFNNSSAFNMPRSLYGLAGGFNVSQYYSPINTKAAAFETTSGDSVAVFYNPRCIDQNYVIESRKNQIFEFFCAYFIFDLNGRKGPNKMGKDVGVMGLISPTNSELVMPIITKRILSCGYNKGITECKKNNSRIPSLPEVETILVSHTRFGWGNEGSYAISNKKASDTKVYEVARGYYYLGAVATTENTNSYTMCVAK